MRSIVKERVDAAVRSIMSGRNDCGTLQDAVAQGNPAYFEMAIAPGFNVYEDEAETYRAEWAASRQEADKLRNALEYIAANMAQEISGQQDVKQIVSAALGRNV